MGWMVLYGSWKRSTLELLRVVGTLRGLDTAACVASLPTVPDVALHTRGSTSLRLLWRVG